MGTLTDLPGGGREVTRPRYLGLERNKPGCFEIDSVYQNQRDALSNGVQCMWNALVSFVTDPGVDCAH